MENASKALIIAGAILLSIAIIGIGMAVFQMASGTISSANMSAQEIEAYNSEFSKYEGKVNGATAKALCATIRTHNQTNDDVSKQIIVNVKTKCTGATVEDTTVGSTSQEVTTAQNTLNAGTRYEVAFDYTSTGLIKVISITKVTTK